MHAGVDLGVVVGALRHAPQALDLGQQPRQGAAVAQHVEHARRLRFHQAARQLLPDALGDQCVDFAGLDHAAHQRHRLGRDAEIGEARREARQPQDAHRILGERLADVAQHFRVEVAPAAVGVDQRAVPGLRHRIDRQVAARQILLERHVGRRMEAEAVVAGRRLALGAREGVFLLRLRVQEDGKVAADRCVAGGRHLARRGADDNPVAVDAAAPEQRIAHRATDHVGLHAGQCSDGPRCSARRAALAAPAQDGGAYCSVHVPRTALRAVLLLYFTAQHAPPS